MKNLTQTFLFIYSLVVTVIFIVCSVKLFNRLEIKKARFDEIEAQQIRIVEPDGTLRMVLSNHKKLPGIIIKGKEEPFERPQAGILFFNDEGSENGGLIFSGYKDENGNIKKSGGSLTFDRYGGNQELQLIGVNDSEYAFTGLIIRDSPPNEQGYRRIWLGKDNEETASLALKDKKGVDRIRLQVDKDGNSEIVFFDENGLEQRKLTPIE